MKKCAVINDLSGFGKCSLTAAIPIISVMGSEVHPLPTAVLSNQTGYDSFKSVSLTGSMSDFICEWKKLGACFDGILTGYVADEEQIDIISTFIDEFKVAGTAVIVDPVMADNGSLYDGYTNEMCEKIKALCFKADVITPNIAELAFIAGEKYSEDYSDLISYGNKLIDMGIRSIVVTGFKESGTVSDIVFDGGTVQKITTKLYGGYFSGTGDITAAVIMGGILRGAALCDAVRLAAEFISRAVCDTENCGKSNGNDGINFEKFLGELI